MSLWSLLTNARKKPESVRQAYALFASVLFTGSVGIAWLFFVRIPPLTDGALPQDAGVYKDSGELLVQEGRAFIETFLRGIDETKKTGEKILSVWKGGEEKTYLYEREE